MEHIISYSDARQNFKSICDLTYDDQVPVFVKMKNGRNIVILSEDDYNSLDETAYLLKNSKNASHLRKSLDDFEKSKVKTFNDMNELID